MNTARRLKRAFGDRPDITVTIYVLSDGDTYLVTSGTGDGTFAYEEAEVDAYLEEIGDAAFDYSDFCAAVSAETDLPVAQELAAEGVHICRPGLGRVD